MMRAPFVNYDEHEFNCCERGGSKKEEAFTYVSGMAVSPYSQRGGGGERTKGSKFELKPFMRSVSERATLLFFLSLVHRPIYKVSCGLSFLVIRFIGLTRPDEGERESCRTDSHVFVIVSNNGEREGGKEGRPVGIKNSEVEKNSSFPFSSSSSWPVLQGGEICETSSLLPLLTQNESLDRKEGKGRKRTPQSSRRSSSLCKNNAIIQARVRKCDNNAPPPLPLHHPQGKVKTKSPFSLAPIA